jgi:hypothetical protein
VVRKVNVSVRAATVRSPRASTVPRTATPLGGTGLLPSFAFFAASTCSSSAWYSAGVSTTPSTIGLSSPPRVTNTTVPSGSLTADAFGLSGLVGGVVGWARANPAVSSTATRT